MNYRTPDQDVPFISAEDPLPRPPELKGRWAEPYIAQASGLWTVHVRKPLTPAEIQINLASTLHASDRETLSHLMARQDERAQRQHMTCGDSNGRKS